MLRGESLDPRRRGIERLGVHAGRRRFTYQVEHREAVALPEQHDAREIPPQRGPLLRRGVFMHPGQPEPIREVAGRPERAPVRLDVRVELVVDVGVDRIGHQRDDRLEVIVALG
jgi:hypothetical protein